MTIRLIHLAATAILSLAAADAAQAQRYDARQHLHGLSTEAAQNGSANNGGNTGGTSGGTGSGGSGGSGSTGGTGGGTQEPLPSEQMDVLSCSSMTPKQEFAGSWRDVGSYTFSLENALDKCVNFQHYTGDKTITGCGMYRNKNAAGFTVYVVRNGAAMRESSRIPSNAYAAHCTMAKAAKGSVPITEAPEPARAQCTGLGIRQMMPVTETANAIGIGYAADLTQAHALCNRESTPVTKHCMAFRRADRGGDYTVWISGDDLKPIDPYYESHVATCG